jgi:hypothetical protein
VVHVHGDATGGRRDTRSGTNDWEIVKRGLTRAGISYRFMVGTKNPSVRERVNDVNFALCSPDGARSLIVDERCKELRTDLKEVGWKKDASGNSLSSLDNGDQRRTHVSDALGYLVHDRNGRAAGGGFAKASPR